MIGKRFIDVDYELRDWSTSRLPAGLPPFHTALPSSTAHSYRDQIANGEARIIGRGRVQGVPTIHVVQVQVVPPPTSAQLAQDQERAWKQFLKDLPKGAPRPKRSSVFPKSALVSSPTEHLKIDTWLDASTYLPIRIRTIRNGVLLDNEYDIFLPRTVKNLGKTHLVIPSGFANPRQASANGVGFAVSDSFLVIRTHKPKAPRCH